MTTSDNVLETCAIIDRKKVSDVGQITGTESEYSSSVSTVHKKYHINSFNLHENDTTTSQNDGSSTHDRDLFKKSIMTLNGESSRSKADFKRSKSKRNRLSYPIKMAINSPRVSKVHKLYRKKLSKNGRKHEKEEMQVVKEPCSANDEVTLMSRLRSSLQQMKEPLPQKANEKENIIKNDLLERIDIYYFDHGNAAYFRTTDCPPTILTEALAQQTTYYATRFWAEIFGSIHIGVVFFVSFFLQTYKFILHSLVRTMIIGFLQMSSDYLLKPLLAIIFNGILQPPIILVYNILSSIRDMLEPVAEIFDQFLAPIANLLGSIRLVGPTRKTKRSKFDNV